MQRKKIRKRKKVRTIKMTQRELDRKEFEAILEHFLEVEMPKMADTLSLL